MRPLSVPSKPRAFFQRMPLYKSSGAFGIRENASALDASAANANVAAASICPEADSRGSVNAHGVSAGSANAAAAPMPADCQDLAESWEDCSGGGSVDSEWSDGETERRRLPSIILLVAQPLTQPPGSGERRQPRRKYIPAPAMTSTATPSITFSCEHIPALAVQACREHMMAMVYLLVEGAMGSRPSGAGSGDRGERRNSMSRANLADTMVGAQIRKRTRMGAPPALATMGQSLESYRRH